MKACGYHGWYFTLKVFILNCLENTDHNSKGSRIKFHHFYILIFLCFAHVHVLPYKNHTLKCECFPNFLEIPVTFSFQKFWLLWQDIQWSTSHSRLRLPSKLTNFQCVLCDRYTYIHAYISLELLLYGKHMVSMYSTYIIYNKIMQPTYLCFDWLFS